MSKYTNEIEKRRTFAIISHPDAGKTTLTEKFLLYGGAINLAGMSLQTLSTADMIVFFHDHYFTYFSSTVHQQVHAFYADLLSYLLPLFCSFIMMVTALIFWIHRDIRISRRILTVH